MRKSVTEYLDYSVTEQEDSIEKIFCEKFAKLKVRNLTTDESMMLITLIMTKEDDNKVIKLYNELMNEKSKLRSIALLILRKRFCEQFSFTVEKRAMILLTSFIDSPGSAVMYGAYLLWWCKKNNTKAVTINDICMKMFPFGFPTDEELSRIWDDQKVRKSNEQQGTDNLLDYGRAYTSLILK